MEAASAGRAANAEILLSAGAKVNAIDENGFTALTWATMLGFPECVKVLLESGAEVNKRSKDGRTAMGISQKIVENTSKSLARAFKSNSDVSELRVKLSKHETIFQMLKEAGGGE
jgi:ankyrin repeat protein